MGSQIVKQAIRGLSSPQVWLAINSNVGSAFQFACAAALGLFAACAFSAARHSFDSLASLCVSGKVSHHQMDGAGGHGSESHSDHSRDRRNTTGGVQDLGDSHRRVFGSSNGSPGLVLVCCDASSTCLAYSDARVNHRSHMTVRIGLAPNYEGRQSDIFDPCHRNASSMVSYSSHHPRKIVFWARFRTLKVYCGDVPDTCLRDDDPSRQTHINFSIRVLCMDNDGPYLDAYRRDVAEDSCVCYDEVSLRDLLALFSIENVTDQMCAKAEWQVFLSAYLDQTYASGLCHRQIAPFHDAGRACRDAGAFLAYHPSAVCRNGGIDRQSCATPICSCDGHLSGIDGNHH